MRRLAVRRQQRRQPGSDLAAGALAALAFVGIFLALGASYLWLSALLAVLVYVGFQWLRPAPPPLADADDAVGDRVAEIVSADPRQLLHTVERLQTQRDAASLRVPLAEVAATARWLLDYGDQHAEQTQSAEQIGAVRFAVTQYLQLIETGLTRFLETARVSGRVAPESNVHMAELIEGVRQRLNALREQLRQRDDAALASELQTLQRTVRDLDEVALLLRGGNE